MRDNGFFSPILVGTLIAAYGVKKLFEGAPKLVGDPNALPANAAWLMIGCGAIIALIGFVGRASGERYTPLHRPLDGHGSWDVDGDGGDDQDEVDEDADDEADAA